MQATHKRLTHNRFLARPPLTSLGAKTKPDTTEEQTMRLFACGLGVFAAQLIVAAASGAASAAPPGPGEPGYCGAHVDPYECWVDTGPATPGEKAFINQVRGHIPGDDIRLLQISRGTCGMLEGGVTTSYIVQDMAHEMGIPAGTAGATLDTAMNTSCPGLVVGPDGAAHPS